MRSALVLGLAAVAWPLLAWGQAYDPLGQTATAQAPSAPRALPETPAAARSLVPSRGGTAAPADLDPALVAKYRALLAAHLSVPGTPPAHPTFFDILAAAPSNALPDEAASKLMLCAAMYEVSSDRHGIGIALRGRKMSGVPADREAKVERSAQMYELEQAMAKAFARAGRSAYGTTPARAAEYDRLQARTTAWGAKSFNSGQDIALRAPRYGCAELEPAAPFRQQREALMREMVASYR